MLSVQPFATQHRCNHLLSKPINGRGKEKKNLSLVPAKCCLIIQTYLLIKRERNINAPLDTKHKQSNEVIYKHLKRNKNIKIETTKQNK